MRSEEQDPGLKGLIGAVLGGSFVKPLAFHHLIVLCPPFDLMHRHERSPRRMPCKVFDNAFTARIFIFPRLVSNVLLIV